MRALQIIPSLSPSSGGPSVALPAIAHSLQSQGVEVHVVTTDDDGPGRHMVGIPLEHEMPQNGGWTVRYFPKQTEFYKVSLPLRRWLLAHVADYDVVHVHALFSFASLVGARTALDNGVPYIIRPLGVLNRWGMENRRRWIKALSLRMFELPLMRRAAAMHYTSRMEMQDSARFHLTNRQAVIPIGIDLSAFAHLPDRRIFFDKHPETTSTRNILFLSRIDEKKGLDLLIKAFSSIVPEHPEVRLIVCGDGDPALVTSLKHLAASLGISNSITWTGFIQGETRLAAYAAAEIFVLPSHSENFGIALLEAMAAGLPCISTDQVALAVDAVQEQAVQLSARDPVALKENIHSLLMSMTRRQCLSAAARRIACRDYSHPAMGASLNQLYNDVVNHPS